MVVKSPLLIDAIELARKPFNLWLKAFGIEDSPIIKVKEFKGKQRHWLGLYRALSQFKDKPIFWINTNLFEIMDEACVDSAKVDEIILDTLKHEYAHVILEWFKYKNKTILSQIALNFGSEEEYCEKFTYFDTLTPKNSPFWEILSLYLEDKRGKAYIESSRLVVVDMANFKCNSEDEYNKKIEALKIELEKANADLKTVIVDYESDEEIKKARDYLWSLTQPHEIKVNEARKLRDDLESEIRKLPYERENFKRMLKLDSSMATDKLTIESFEAFMILNKLEDAYANKYKFKRHLSNDIDVFNAHNSENNRYFLFYGAKLVGFWVRRIAKHRADETFSRAWIGVSKLEDGYRARKTGCGTNLGVKNDVEYYESRLVGVKTHKDYPNHVFYRKCEYDGRIDPTIEDFLDYVENNVRHHPMVEIDINDEVNHTILKEGVD